ncbi:C13 family peptidase [Phenylobacterium sp.]|uniref:C13 family peptidase n=1 Tax=Phenylobacterium sp. TaxID=1871053 RepID=UPI0035AE9234
MTRGLARLVAILGALWLTQAAPAGASPFADWAAVVVAGDWQSHDGGPTEAFDNARRDVVQALGALGFRRENVRQFSVRPDRYRDRPQKAEVEAIYGAMSDLARQATGGCLLYLTSHGAPEGVVVDQDLLPPGVLGQMVEHTCGQRPTVVVISACFSGGFVPALAAPNRMILTAARRDRSSFGCGEADKYPYFDDCFLQAMPRAREFWGLGRQVQSCVAAREQKEGMKPPSEPQLYVGGALRPLLPLLPFGGSEPAAN